MNRLSNKSHWMPWVYLALIVASAISIAILYGRQQSLISTNKKLILLEAKHTKQIARESRQRDTDIQRSRFLSCKTTYSSIRGVIDLSLGISPFKPRARVTAIRRLPPVAKRKTLLIYALVNPDKCKRQVKTR